MVATEFTSIDTFGKRVLLRIDSDVDKINESDPRLIAASDTIKALVERNAKIIVIGHRGRPDGKVDNELSLKSVSDVLSKLTGKNINFVYDLVGAEAHDESAKLSQGEVLMLENLRFDSREESNDENFAKSLAELGDVFVNDAFASSHREHASIVGIPKILPSAIGLRLVREIANLSKVLGDPKRPLLFLISGLKKDKLEYVKKFEEFADKILIGGRLPELLGDKALESVRTQSGKVITGNLVMDKEDITLNTIEVFEKEIAKAKTIVLSGPLGKYEDEGHRQGTERVLMAIVKNKEAFKIAGGGDSEAAINTLKIEGFDWVSVGGGAMLEFLSSGSLPGIDAVTK